MNQDRIEVLQALSVRVSAYAKRLSKAPHDEVLVEPLRSLYKVQATVTWQLHGLLSDTSPPRLAPRLAAPEVILDRAFRDLRSLPARALEAPRRALAERIMEEAERVMSVLGPNVDFPDDPPKRPPAEQQ